MEQTTETRKCFSCKKTLPLEKFQSCKSHTKGKKYICKKCSVEAAKKFYKNNKNYRISELLRSCLRRIVQNRFTVKTSKVSKYLGCSIGEFLRYIESNFQDGMTWENHGYEGWHLDHKIPCSKFDLTKEEEIKKCFHYTNIQPLWKNQNLEKGSRVLKEVDGTQVFWSPCEESKGGPIMGPNIFEEF